jgi:hypothetical protein
MTVIEEEPPDPCSSEVMGSDGGEIMASEACGADGCGADAYGASGAEDVGGADDIEPEQSDTRLI